MSNLQEIEKKISELNPKELAQFRDWFEKFDAAAWDTQFEKDVSAGKLDKIAERAMADFNAGHCTDL